MSSLTNSGLYIKWLLLLLLLFFLFTPLIQEFTGVKTRIEPLDGSFTLEKDTTIDVQSWFDGGYQHQKEKFVSDNFGLRPYYVRANSQVDFCMFNKANAAYVIVGKENYLYEKLYPQTYYGVDFIGAKAIDNYIHQLKAVQDSMRKLNKLLVVVLAPGKASYYPEYIPEKLKTPPQPSNYLYFREAMAFHNVTHIDFNRHFVEQKHRSKYPLYPQFGIHWSNYGSILAFDSLTRFVENKLNINLPDIIIEQVTMSDSLQNTDDDIIKGMNLLWRPKTFKMAYAEFKVKRDSTIHKQVKLLSVADSFWWYIYSINLPREVFGADNEFWFYNEAMYPQSFNSMQLVSQSDYFTKIRSFDVIVMLHTEATLARFGKGFVQMAYDTYCKPSGYREKLQKLKASIIATKPWYEEVTKKAAEKGISVDSMVTLDAIHMMTHPEIK